MWGTNTVHIYGHMTRRVKGNLKKCMIKNFMEGGGGVVDGERVGVKDA